MINLECPDCGTDTWFEINPWQTNPDQWDAIAMRCTDCCNVRIFKLVDGLRLHLPGE